MNIFRKKEKWKKKKKKMVISLRLFIFPQARHYEHIQRKKMENRMKKKLVISLKLLIEQPLSQVSVITAKHGEGVDKTRQMSLTVELLL